MCVCGCGCNLCIICTLETTNYDKCIKHSYFLFFLSDMFLCALQCKMIIWKHVFGTEWMLFLLISDEIILFCIDTKILHRVCYQSTIGHLPSNALQTRQSQTLKTKTFSILFSFLFLAIENNSFSSFYFFFSYHFHTCLDDNIFDDNPHKQIRLHDSSKFTFEMFNRLHLFPVSVFFCFAWKSIQIHNILAQLSIPNVIIHWAVSYILYEKRNIGQQQ